MKSLKIGDLLARTPIYRGGGFFYFVERKEKPAAPKGATGRALIQI